MSTRKIIQIATMGGNTFNDENNYAVTLWPTIFALTNDGAVLQSVLRNDNVWSKWKELPPIPLPKAITCKKCGACYGEDYDRPGCCN